MVQAPPRAVDSAIVYEAVNLVNNHRYIGFTSQGLPRREWQHRMSVRGRRLYRFQHALKKFGDENFVFRVLFDFQGDEELAKIYEEEAIAKYAPEYNLRGGGKGGAMHPETRQKLSDVQKGRPSPLRGVSISIEHRQAIIDGKKKRSNKHTQETKEKIRGILKGRVRNPESTRKAIETYKLIGPSHKRGVRCVEDGREFITCTAACKFYGIYKGGVSAAAIGGRVVKGLTFVFVDGRQ